jgi:pSer/pThr/pTyr-binding forkhead associated (FHA) protein
MVWYVLFAAPQSPVSAVADNSSGLAHAPWIDPARQRHALPNGAAWGFLAPEPSSQDTILIHLATEVVLVGRDPGADLILPDERVSRYHAEIRWESDEAWVKDLGSLNGTRVNHIAVAGKMMARDGALLEFGDRCFRFVRAALRQSVVPGDGQGPSSALEVETRKTSGVSGLFGSSAPPLALVWRAGTASELEWVLLDPVTTVGRDASCAIVIPDDSVSRLHAHITRQPSGYYIVDVESSNGIFLNDKQVTSPQPLHSGDTVRLGEAIITVRDRKTGVVSMVDQTGNPQATRAEEVLEEIRPRGQKTTKPRFTPPLPPAELSGGHEGA